MAGDWIKIEKCLLDKPEVDQIAALTGLGRWDVCGRLFAVWAWADSHTADGDMVGVGPETIDRIAGHEGFAVAMKATRPSAWLLIDEQGITIPAYDRHNGKNAKKRAMEKNRQDLHRSRTGKESGYRPWHHNNPVTHQA